MTNAPARERSQRLQMETLVIASLASAAAALATSLVWRPGTILSAALTPVIVAFVSQMLQRPAQRITQVRAVRRVPATSGPAAEAPEIRAARLHERELAAVGPPGPVRDRLSAPPEPAGADDTAPRTPPPAAAGAPLRVYRKRRPSVRAALVTGAVAFAVAAAALTLPELIGGGSVTGDGRTTLFSAGDGERDSGDRGDRRPDDDGRPAERSGELREPGADGGSDESRTAPSEGSEEPDPAPGESAPEPTAPDVPAPR